MTSIRLRNRTEHDMDTTDKECVERCRNGEPEYYRFLVARYQGPLFSYLAGRLRDRFLAEEAAQESLVRAFFGMRQLKKPESFHAWLLGIAGRVAYEFQRSSNRHFEAGDLAESMAAAPAQEEENEDLNEAIAALPESYRRVILLRYYEELSCQQVADRLGVPLGTATKTLSRAYAELRRLLPSDRRSGPMLHPEVKP